MDGSKQSIALRGKLRADLIVMMRALGAYVELCGVDLPTFLKSGFTPISTVRTRTVGPLEKPSIKGLEQGTTGQLLVSLKSVARAIHYELRFSEVVDGMTAAGSSVLIASVKNATAINNLTAGRIYAFAVRAFGSQGHTDWSESASRMCI